MKKTVLIFGASSFLGSNLARFLSDEYRVIGTYFNTPVNIPGITCVPCDVLKKDYVSNLIGKLKPDYTIYAVGMSSLSECKADPKTADGLNSVGAVNCSNSSERYNSKFVYISSCFVHAGVDVLYKESDTPFPATVYGSTLSTTEFYIQRSSLNYLILRTCPLYGRSYNPLRPNLFDVLQIALAKNEVITLDDSVKTGFIDVYLFAKMLKSILASEETNRLLQISSEDYLTRFEFAKLYAKVFKKDENLIKASTATFPQENANRNIMSKSNSDNLFFRMDTTNIEEVLGSPLPRIEESLSVTLKRLS